MTLTKDWKKYTVKMRKDASFDGDIHLWADRAGTVWLSEMQLEDGAAATSFIAENGGLFKTEKAVYGGTYALSSPTRVGYDFAGWYTRAAGGTKITSSTAVKKGHYRLYAHWTPKTYTAEFYNNCSGKNYLLGSDFSSLKKDFIYSVDTAYATVASDTSVKHGGKNAVKVVHKKAGSTNGKYVDFITSTQNASSKGYLGDKKTMTMSFWAKSSVAGTKFSFRWGYESNTRTVTLTKDWEKYTIRMDKAKSFDHKIHAWADRAGTVWFSEMQLEDGTSATSFAAENGGLCTTVKETYTKTYQLPKNPSRSGYLFWGWADSAKSRVGLLNRLTADMVPVLPGNTRFYAVWTPVLFVLFDGSVLTMTEGETRTVTVDLGDTETAADLADSVVWKSSDPAVASVEKGAVTAVSAGSAEITAETPAGDRINTYSVTVTAKPEPQPQPQPQPQPSPFRFDDVTDESAYFFTPVYWAVDHDPQITNGVDATHFKPDDPCTRGQVVTFLWRTFGGPDAAAANPFTDVAAGSYYEKAVVWAVSKGITKGTGETTFSPDDPCTRGQVVTFLWRTYGTADDGAANPFTDVAAGSYYEKAVLWAVSKGITKGTGETTFSPEKTCTRCQVVTFLYRASLGG